MHANMSTPTPTSSSSSSKQFDNNLENTWNVGINDIKQLAKLPLEKTFVTMGIFGTAGRKFDVSQIGDLTGKVILVTGGMEQRFPLLSLLSSMLHNARIAY
jgi:hypothetical protein